MNRAMLFLMIILSSFVCHGGTIDPNTPDIKYIETAKNFEYVLQLEGVNEQKYIVLGSCVLIDKNWIVTAAHVAREMKSCKIIYDDKKIDIDKIIIHKNFTEKDFGLADIAMMHLSQSILLENYPKLYSDNNEIDNICYIVGFGFSGTFETGSKFNDNKKRAGSNVIDKIDNDLLICSPSKNDKITDLEFLIAHGDSGGGLFIENKLAGINSCVMTKDGKPNSSYGDESGHTRISLYKDWIMSNIHE